MEEIKDFMRNSEAILQELVNHLGTEAGKKLLE